jgi:myo-inositol 2-dehydrogenase / D-chiro-inositol 1-dehydrogenase
MRARIADGAIGTPQLLRSLTRDPGITADVAARVKPWTIFNETLIHDFDTLCWLNPGARVTEVYAQADALIHPGLKDSGFLDTAVVQLRFDNGAFAIAEASFQAVYGYDVRGEVFGSDGVLSAGREPQLAAAGNTDLFADAYVAQFAHFADCVRSETEPSVTGRDARVALEIALAARESVETGAPVLLNAVLR